MQTELAKMNISRTSHSTYPIGYQIDPVSRIKSRSSNTDLGKESQLNPEIKPESSDQQRQISKTGNATTNTGTPSLPGSNPEHEAQTNGVHKPETQAQNTQEQEKQTENTTTANGHALTQAEMQLVEALKQVDSEVRSHEMAHVAAGGRFITSGANFSYKRGPDGKNYAVAGEVGIDTSPVPGDPAATVQKMRQIKNSALAPTNPSSQDLKVASKASSIATKAISELMILTTKEQAQSNEKTVFGDQKTASDSYERVSNMPESEPSTFQIAV